MGEKPKQKPKSRFHHAPASTPDVGGNGSGSGDAAQDRKSALQALSAKRREHRSPASPTPTAPGESGNSRQEALQLLAARRRHNSSADAPAPPASSGKNAAADRRAQIAELS